MTKKNKTKIKGDNNVTLTDIRDSDITIDKSKKKRRTQFWVIAGVIIALLGLIIQILIGWENIIGFLYDGQDK